MENGFPMKYHKFLIYFSLWLGAAINLLGGIAIVTGMILGEDMQAVYAAFPGYQALNVVYGCILLLLAAVCVAVRTALARYRRRGPKMLIALLTVNLILAPLYGVLAGAVTRIPLGQLMDASDAAQFAGTLAIVIATFVYYKKRESLFVE